MTGPEGTVNFVSRECDSQVRAVTDFHSDQGGYCKPVGVFSGKSFVRASLA